MIKLFIFITRLAKQYICGHALINNQGSLVFDITILTVQSTFHFKTWINKQI